MNQRPLFWQLFPTIALTAVLALVLAGVQSYRIIASTIRKTIYEHLETEAMLAAHAAAPLMAADDKDAVHILARSLGDRSNTRLTFVRPDGEVLGDTEAFPEAMENHADRREIRTAFAGGIGRSERYSATRQRMLIYVAVPVRHNERLIGISRASKPVEDVGQILAYVQREFTTGILILGLLAAGVTLLLTRHLLRPLSRLRDAAGALESGRFDIDLTMDGSREIQALAHAMRTMRDTIREKLQTIERQRTELEHILANMGDGVLAVDGNCHILLINRAACDLLGVPSKGARGALAHERIRRSAVLQLLDRVLESDEALREELMLRGEPDLVLDVHATRLAVEGAETAGALLVLRDVTPFRQMKMTLRTFVENASHELRTPITAIKGVLETVLDMHRDDPEQAERFLQVAAKHTNRLEALTDDLLTLARIERDGSHEQAELQPESVADVVQSVVDATAPMTGRSSVEVRIDVADDLVASVRRPLLEIAVQNLLDNALKFSPPDAEVTVRARRAGGEIVLEVQDAGPGIPEKHFPFLFNRFYRVDESRSRELGGTGLGLSIVKHIALLHRGRVSVDSRVGGGSTFRIHLPEPVEP